MPKIFPGLPYPASSIERYLQNLHYFTFGLKDGRVASFAAQDPEALVKWLKKHHIPEVWDIDVDFEC